MSTILTRLTRTARQWSTGAEGSWSAEDLTDFERTLAMIRVALAASLAILALATASEQSGPVVWAIVAYCAYAVGVRARFALGIVPTLKYQLLTQATDLFAAAVFALLWPAFSAAGSVLFLYAFLGASVRWGGRACFACVILVVCLLLGEFARSGSLARAGAGGGLGSDLLLLQLAYLVVIGVVFSHVGYVARERRANALALSRLKEAARLDNGFRGSLHAVLADLCQLFGAQSARVLTHDRMSNLAFLWVLDSAHATTDGLRCVEITGTDPAHPEAALGNLDATRVWRAPFLTAEWAGQVILVQPKATPVARRRMTVFVRAVREITPVLYDIHRIARVRSRAVARERARLSRHIHDDTIQALLGTEMQLEALWHQCRNDGLESITTELVRIRMHVHREVLNLRDLMLLMKPMDVTAAELPDLLGDVVGRFAHDTGVDVTFDGAELAGFDLGRRTCAEIARIVQEALTNVRKHSGATHALVQVVATPTGPRLVIEDNGVGFDFEGRVQLVSTRGTPLAAGAGDAPASSSQPRSRSWTLAAMRESVRAIAGELVVQSTRGRCARLEISIPARAVSAAHSSRIAS